MKADVSAGELRKTLRASMKGSHRSPRFIFGDEGLFILGHKEPAINDDRLLEQSFQAQEILALMKHIHVIALILLLASCTTKNVSSSESISSGSHLINIDGSRYTIALYDSCQYLISRSDHSITHIGSCTNRIHSTYHCDTLIIHDTVFVDKRVKHKY